VMSTEMEGCAKALTAASGAMPGAEHRRSENGSAGIVFEVSDRFHRQLAAAAPGKAA
jgi:hypothetical protein